MKKVLLLILGGTLVLGVATLLWASVIDTPHDIVPGAEPCAFCHTPHNALQYPLWNREFNYEGTYDLYASPSFDMMMPVGSQPRAPSTLCLVCHNGILSTIVNFPGPCNNNADSTYDVTVEGCADLGTNLTDDHPVSFNYHHDWDIDRNGFIVEQNVASPGATRTRMAIVGQITGTNYFLYGPGGATDSNWFECSTCHAVHHTAEPPYEGAGDTQVYFLRTDNTRSQMCRDCHINR